jgi:hypothetical protein
MKIPTRNLGLGIIGISTLFGISSAPVILQEVAVHIYYENFMPYYINVHPVAHPSTVT